MIAAMILAGIDEAGYGPVLGPLVSGGCAFEVPGRADGAAGPLPDVWKMLTRVVSAKKPADGRRIHVNDSKRVHTPAAGPGALEHAVLSLAGADASTLDRWLAGISPGTGPSHAGYDWYRPAAGERFPLVADATAVRLMANAFRSETVRTGVRPVYLQTHALCEREYNRFVAATRNKAAVILMLVLRHVASLINRFSGDGLVIVCDRLGGRSKYGGVLRSAFEDWALTIESESDSRADYSLARDGARVRIIFCEKAESLALPVAAASMLAKYHREALMHRFNAYWTALAPAVAPTAGYYTDGMRFLAETSELRARIGITDEQIIRSR